MEITVDGWLILRCEIKGQSSGFFKIFASWRDGDVWRLSSGANSLRSISKDSDNLIWPQYTGSIYRLPIKAQGMCTIYTANILRKQILKNTDELGIKMTVVDLLPEGTFNYDAIKHLEFSCASKK